LALQIFDPDQNLNLNEEHHQTYSPVCLGGIVRFLHQPCGAAPEGGFECPEVNSAVRIYRSCA